MEYWNLIMNILCIANFIMAIMMHNWHSAGGWFVCFLLI